jgi:hypothetical protein
VAHLSGFVVARLAAIDTNWYGLIGICDQAPGAARYGRFVHHLSALVAEVANELATWPGVRIDRPSNGVAIVRYEHSELGVLYPDRGVAELPAFERERDVLIEHGDAEPAEPTASSVGISHSIHGPSDIAAVLELFDRRYRDVRGEDDPYSSEDPAYPHGRLDQL